MPGLAELEQRELIKDMKFCKRTFRTIMEGKTLIKDLEKKKTRRIQSEKR